MISNFIGADRGEWRILHQQAVCGVALPPATHLAIDPPEPGESGWKLRGTTSNLRYTDADERRALQLRQAGLGRSEARLAALIPIRKSAAWWALAQDERLAIYRRSQHTMIGMDYLPAIARRLYHSRDLVEPFDFLTWFEFASKDEPAFDALLVRLRASEEWQFVEHDVDIRLIATA